MTVHDISIHAPLAGCDTTGTPAVQVTEDFNPRTPCGVRLGRRDGAGDAGHFNPRTPCGVRQVQNQSRVTPRRFQSTHPLRGATPSPQADTRHAHHFNPRTPCGVRHKIDELVKEICDFNPRTPCGVRQAETSAGRTRRGISIHAPLAGCDTLLLFYKAIRLHFNPRTPCGVRHARKNTACNRENISIHAPLAGCDRYLQGNLKGQRDFNPRTPCGVRRQRANTAQ